MPALTEVAYIVQVQSGESVLLPGGWPYAQVCLTDTLLLGAQLLHVHNLGLHVSVLTCSAPRPPTPLSPLSCCWGHSYCTYTTSA